MQPGLNLKIPDLQSNLYSALRSQSPSPKPHLTKATKKKPYSRIVSNKNIKSLTIPSFLQTTTGSQGRIKKPSHSLVEDTTNISSVKGETSQRLQVLMPKTKEEIFELVFCEQIKDCQKMLKVGKVLLTKGELKSLHPEFCIERKVIDACLRCMKHVNRKYFKINEDRDRVFIVDTVFSQALFTGVGKECCGKRNTLKYNLVVFPLFLGYWTLVVLDNRMIKVTVYNVDDQQTLAEILDSIKQFIDLELKTYEKKCIQCSSWSNLQLESIKTHPMTQIESSAYLLKLAYKLSIKPDSDLDQSTLSNFRFKLLILLFNHGTLIL